MNSVKNTWKSNYTTVSNALINCHGLSAMTRFLCIYLACQSNTYQFTNKGLCNALGVKEATLRKYMKEAESVGLITRKRKKVGGKFGFYDYTLHDPATLTMLQNLPHGKKTTLEKNHTGKSVRLNKEEEVNKEEVKNKEREIEDTPELSESEKAEAFIKAHTPPRNGFDPFSTKDKPEWGGGTEQDYQYIYQKIADHLNSNPRTWAEVASLAYCKMTPDQFKKELVGWIRYYLPQQRLFRNPVQNLRGGRISFVGWLKKPWPQKEYNPSHTDNNQPRSTAGTRRTVR